MPKKTIHCIKTALLLFPILSFANMPNYLYLGKGKFNPADYKEYRCKLMNCSGRACKSMRVYFDVDKKLIERSHNSFLKKDKSNIAYLIDKIKSDKRFIRWCRNTDCDIAKSEITKVEWSEIYKYVKINIHTSNGTVTTVVECYPYDKEKAFNLK